MKWSDEFWPLLVQLYKKKPEGVKPIYSRGLVDISLLLHITPQELHKKMMELRNPKSPFMKQMWEEYSSQRKLNKAATLLREKEGFGTSGEFFKDVDTCESFELDFKPIPDDTRLMPISLILILDLYFQLTPTTMVSDTEEIQDLSKLIKAPVSLILEIMEIFQFCDPYLNRDDVMIHPLLFKCQEIWNRYGNDDTEKLASMAAQLKEYFR